jgi:hypothetical protein
VAVSKADATQQFAEQHFHAGRIGMKLEQLSQALVEGHVFTSNIGITENEALTVILVRLGHYEIRYR